LPGEFLYAPACICGLVSQYGTLGIVNKAPHPNAAKVFINWFLSRDGQIALQSVMVKTGEGASDSLRIYG
jgi:ABC-type Fe3+ transport system substrate-binding protein